MGIGRVTIKADPKHPMLVELVAKCKSKEITSTQLVATKGARKIDTTGPTKLACADILETTRQKKSKDAKLTSQ